MISGIHISYDVGVTKRQDPQFPEPSRLINDEKEAHRFMTMILGNKKCDTKFLSKI
jgi:hypothetical protein